MIKISVFTIAFLSSSSQILVVCSLLDIKETMSASQQGWKLFINHSYKVLKVRSIVNQNTYLFSVFTHIGFFKCFY